MRHTNSGLSEDDLSRLTGTSTNNSSSITTPSRDSFNNNNNDCPGMNSTTEQQEELEPLSPCPVSPKTQSLNPNFNSTYLPEIIEPLDWQKSRKRKERQDSSSSTTQERKLVRSNSEEIIPNSECEVIRRVSSSEDFKRPNESTEKILKIRSEDNEKILKTIEENDKTGTESVPTVPEESTKHAPRLETSPARSHRRYRDTDEMEYENERRRSSERFCKSRAQSGRKLGVLKKCGGSTTGSGKYIPKYRSDDMISALKNERRGFVSQFKVEERGTRKEEATDGEKIHDLNDNNLIDFHRSTPEATSTSTSAATATSQTYGSSAEALPWDSANAPEPVLSQRCEQMDDDTPKPQIITDNEPVKSFRTFTKMENIKTREIMQKRESRESYETPEDRLKQINKKLIALKKRLSVCEESFEKKTGYRPSQIDKYNDKQIKVILTEINKLRKEKQELKADPMMAMGLKVKKLAGTSTLPDSKEKIDKMKETLSEMEKKLIEKREESNRPATLDVLTADQLVQEKTSVQHALLYYESLYGRPSTKDERDLARNLYERYRLLKRMVSRSITISGPVACGTDLPTILENEPLAFTAEQTTPIKTSPTDSTESLEAMPPPPAPVQEVDEDDEEETTTTTTEETTKSKQKPSLIFGEKVHNLSIDELWKYLDKARDEKREVKRTIREYETLFEEQNGRKMLKHDRKFMEETFLQYKELKAKVRLLQALVRKHISH